ncbi:TPR repeat protein (modular protein) [Desulfamplus magnetovallimortis]|uniref:TPR repeat protein (Modular protein) n=1 Tax=Desulfamplus magnetovallimortis TaxID=1246637 RepID=A0A1W1HE09_9BACT|nr:tetratricopeptide repeat protein [Desulfamplus magnetovallimortis]SLM30605.1 TPR repeat protein (modular protein) [Desulfamplus magnetovallimortis]
MKCPILRNMTILYSDSGKPISINETKLLYMIKFSGDFCWKGIFNLLLILKALFPSKSLTYGICFFLAVIISQPGCTLLPDFDFSKPDESVQHESIDSNKNIDVERNNKDISLQEYDLNDALQSEGTTGDINEQNSAYYYYVEFERRSNRGELEGALDALEKAIEKEPDSIYLKKKLVFLHLSRKETDTAVEIAEKMYEDYPDDVSVLHLLAKLKQQQNKMDEARELYQKLLKKDGENRDVFIILGNMYMENGSYDEAFRVFTRMAENFPEDYASYFFMGKIHVEKQNYVYAEEAFKKCIELKNDLVEPRFELISIYKKHNDNAGGNSVNFKRKIMVLYREILDIEPNNIRASIEMPLFLYESGDKKAASSMFMKLAKKSQKNPAISMIVARELIGNEKFAEASIVFTEMLKGDPENSDLLYFTALAFDGLKQNDKAIEYLLKVSPDSEQYKKSVIHVAFLYNEMEQNDTAIHFLEKKHEEMPRDIDIISYLASMYEEKGKLSDALRILRRGLDYSPDNLEILFRSGVVLDKSGEKSACIETMKRVIELEPEYASALNYLGYTYAEMGINLDDAEKMIIKALELKPDDGYIMDSLGWVYYKKKMFVKAVELLEKAEKLSSGDPLILEHLGDAYIELEMKALALDAYERALSKSQDAERQSVLQEKIDSVKQGIK